MFILNSVIGCVKRKKAPYQEPWYGIFIKLRIISCYTKAPLILLK